MSLFDLPLPAFTLYNTVYKIQIKPFIEDQPVFSKSLMAEWLEQVSQ